MSGSTIDARCLGSAVGRFLKRNCHLEGETAATAPLMKFIDGLCGDNFSQETKTKIDQNLDRIGRLHDALSTDARLREIQAKTLCEKSPEEAHHICYVLRTLGDKLEKTNGRLNLWTGESKATVQDSNRDPVCYIERPSRNLYRLKMYENDSGDNRLEFSDNSPLYNFINSYLPTNRQLNSISYVATG